MEAPSTVLAPHPGDRAVAPIVHLGSASPSLHRPRTNCSRRTAHQEQKGSSAIDAFQGGSVHGWSATSELLVIQSTRGSWTRAPPPSHRGTLPKSPPLRTLGRTTHLGIDPRTSSSVFFLGPLLAPVMSMNLRHAVGRFHCVQDPKCRGSVAPTGLRTNATPSHGQALLLLP